MLCPIIWIWGRVVSVPEKVLSDTHWSDTICVDRSDWAHFFGFGVRNGSVPQKGYSDTHWSDSICLGRSCCA